MDTTATWFHECPKIHLPTLALLLMFQSLKDYLVEVAVGEKAE